VNPGGERPEIEASLKERGVRLTAQRFAVMDFLASHPVHATADQIFEAVNRHDPRSSRATVYNSLRVLIEAGLVREVALEGRAARYDANLSRHHHFVCDRCGNLEDIEWFDLPVSKREALGSREVRDYELVLRGLCMKCKKTARSEKRRTHHG
jgi:Fur family transcriptional regulator, peroxide stress response regulator